MDYFPVFLDLTARRTLVVGGGIVAARKVEMLLRARALVRVVALELHAQLAAHRDAGRIEHLAAMFEPRHLDAVVLAIAATDQSQVNRAVAAAGAARNIFVNVVDDAASSSWLMPAIVDRSPLIVAVGTSGQAPSLARRLRAQLEALLPERLGELASLAGRLRERVQRVLPDLQRRRLFWDGVFAGEIAAEVLAGRASAAQALIEQQLQSGQSAAPRGEVYLIGAGPGDPDLLTLRAQQLLQQADVVLYDRLVSEAVLARVRREAERIYVGKETGQHRATQERIHALLLQYVARGLRVARLKGGDPLVFARGGEELQLLRRAGVSVTVVPGITAALGAAASVGLALTQRGVAPSVTLVTAMGEGTEALDWRALAAPMHTVVFYMGVAQLPRIVERLVTHGAPPERPAVIVEHATLPTQRVLWSCLSQIVARAAQAHIGAPALLIIGEVAAHAGDAADLLPFLSATGTPHA